FSAKDLLLPVSRSLSELERPVAVQCLIIGGACLIHIIKNRLFSAESLLHTFIGSKCRMRGFAVDLHSLDLVIPFFSIELVVSRVGNNPVCNRKYRRADQSSRKHNRCHSF